MKIFTLGALALLVFGTTQPVLAQRTNLSFETPRSEDPQRPQDWKFFGGGYEVALDSSARDGQRSLRLVRPRAGGSAAVSQMLDVTGLQASRVRLTGYVRTLDATGGTAGLAMMVRGSDPSPLYMETMNGTGAFGTQEWTPYEIELPLPRQAVSVQFGAAFNGAGTAWFDGLEIMPIAPSYDTARPSFRMSESKVARETRPHLTMPSLSPREAGSSLSPRATERLRETELRGA